jgi:hypothetical protein
MATHQGFEGDVIGACDGLYELSIVAGRGCGWSGMNNH